jgi:hypothetical protein
MVYKHLRHEAKPLLEYTLFSTPKVIREERRHEQGEEFNPERNYSKDENQAFTEYLG